jgi:hypothetical protein
MSNTYLQDFGLLRKQMNDREVNDPMSGSGRWEDLQMDLRQPHIPQARRASMPANRKLKIGDLEISIKKPDAKLTMAFGFVGGGCAKYALSSPKAITYRTRLRDSWRSKAATIGKSVETYCPHGSVAEAIKYYVRKTRFATIPSVADRYRQKIKTLWPVRRVGR